jgi:hypothetical protein
MRLNIAAYKKRHETVSFPFVLYGCETWSLTLREGHRLRVFKDRCRGRYLYLKGRKTMEKIA